MIGAWLFEDFTWKAFGGISFGLVLFGVIWVAWNFLWRIPRRVARAKQDEKIINEIYSEIMKLILDQWHWETHEGIEPEQWFRDHWEPRYLELTQQCRDRVKEQFGERMSADFMGAPSATPPEWIQIINQDHRLCLNHLEGSIKFLKDLIKQRCSIIRGYWRVEKGKIVREGYMLGPSNEL